MKNLVKDASMGPLRAALRQGIEITKLKKEDMRPVTLQVIIVIHAYMNLSWINLFHFNLINSASSAFFLFFSFAFYL